MKKIIYSLVFLFLLALSNQVSAQAGGAPDIDYGVFDIGTYNGAPPANATLEVAIKPLATFASVPVAAELNWILKLPSALYNPLLNFDVTHEANLIGNATMNYDPNQTFEYAGDWYFVITYNGPGINMSTAGSNNWVYAFTIYITNMGIATPADFSVADASSNLFIDFGPPFRTAINFLGNNEFNLLAEAGSLPLDLISFEAEKYQDRSTQLTWVTVNEINTSNFVVQRSYDKKQWQSIGSVAAAGNSLNIEHYSFIDEGVYNGLDSRLNVYYRLVMVDLDGKSEVSPVESVVFGSGTGKTREFLVYPNPASEGVHVEWTSTDADNPTSLEFYDLSGKLVYTQEVPENSNEEYVDFTKTAIHSGLFIMRVMSGDLPLEYKQIVVDKH